MRRIIDFENVKWDEATKRMFEESEKEIYEEYTGDPDDEKYTWEDYVAAVKKWNADPTKSQKLKI